MDPKKLHIAMCYFPQQFWDEEHLKQAVDCGIDLFIYLIENLFCKNNIFIPAFKHIFPDKVCMFVEHNLIHVKFV